MLKLENLLAWKRPARTATEIEFIRKYIDSVPGMQHDDYGNRYIRIGDSNVMFSCHTDTVHSSEGMQVVGVDNIRNEYFVVDENSNCLGADDSAGIYVMLKLIEANRPGLYVFHRDEEIGGEGSVFFCRNGDISGIEQCIALDRKGTNSVITSQGGRCCSNEYANALCDMLNTEHAGLESEYEAFDFKPDPTGTFTDSANYIGHIPECTNLSVGYFRQHSSHEHQLINFPDELFKVLLCADLESLPIKRDVNEIEEIGYQRHGGYRARINNFSTDDSFNDSYIDDFEYNDDELEYDDIYDFVISDPDAVANLLFQWGVTGTDLNHFSTFKDALE